MITQQEKSFDTFELGAAVLLGLGAIFASLAGHQEGLWGGASVEAYGEAAAMTTKAATTYNDELTTYMQDVQTDVRAKELIWEGRDTDDDAAGSRRLGMANWLLLNQLSDAAYEQLGLPADKRKAYQDADGDARDDVMLSDHDALSALGTDLGDDYVKAVFSESQEQFEAADKRFGEGRVANNLGDDFSLATVIFTVSLFFAGLSLIFKSKVRWAFLGLGTIVFVGGLGYMLSLTWA